MAQTWSGSGTEDDPWQLLTPPHSSSYTAYVDEAADPPLLVCLVGSTRLTYLARVLDDLPVMLREHGDWMLLGSKDEKQEAKPGTIEHWGRSEENPVGGWYGQRKGYRGRLAMYVPPILEALGRLELEHNKRSNRVRAREG